MRRLIVLLLLLGVALSAAACVVAPAGPGYRWCYWHPYRC